MTDTINLPISFVNAILKWQRNNHKYDVQHHSFLNIVHAAACNINAESSRILHATHVRLNSRGSGIRAFTLTDTTTTTQRRRHDDDGDTITNLKLDSPRTKHDSQRNPNYQQSFTGVDRNPSKEVEPK